MKIIQLKIFVIEKKGHYIIITKIAIWYENYILMFSYYFKFKMENHQPKTYLSSSLHRVASQCQLSDLLIDHSQSQSIDFILNHLITDEIPPFVVTKNSKIRREQLSPQLQSEQECLNIQDKILSYNRKDKSLMELTRKFIHKFEGAASNILVLDQVTVELNVERRRIYDIINIMQSLNVVCKIRKNVYEWKGLKKAVQTIQMCSNGIWPEENQKTKKQKSLQSLATQFLKLFSQRKQVLTLEEAAQLILSQVNQNVKKTKIRRLYDIVNVFKCLGLVQKVKSPKNLGGKPTYQWLGYNALLKIIEEKQNLFNPTQEPDETINSSSSFNVKKQQQMEDEKIEQKNFKNHIGQDEVNKPVCLNSRELGLRDISNSQSLIIKKDQKKQRRNSDLVQKKSKKQNVPLKKHLSFTDARKSTNLNIEEIMRNQNINRNHYGTPSFPFGIQMEQLTQGPSFFHNLIKHLNNSGNGSINEIHNKLTKIIWPH